MMSAIGLGLYYDEETGYRMVRHVNGTLEEVIGEQIAFSNRSEEEMGRYNEMLTGLMTDAAKGLSEGILTNFQLFADGIEAIKEKIFKDVESVNSLDFSRFGSSDFNSTDVSSFKGTIFSFSLLVLVKISKLFFLFSSS